MTTANRKLHVVVANNTGSSISEVWISVSDNSDGSKARTVYSSKYIPFGGVEPLGPVDIAAAGSYFWRIFWTYSPLDYNNRGLNSTWTWFSLLIGDTNNDLIISLPPPSLPVSGLGEELRFEQANKQIKPDKSVGAISLLAAMKRPLTSTRGNWAPYIVDTISWGRRQTTPGNVAIALSGGGSRAMCAAVGQLRGLGNAYLAESEARGKSLLSNVKMTSVVSGASWAVVPFNYMKNYSDDEYLGRFVKSPGDIEASDLQFLSPANVGSYCTSGFDKKEITTKLFLLTMAAGTDFAYTRVWQTLIANQFLVPYQLYNPIQYSESGIFYAGSAFTMFKQDIPKWQPDPPDSPYNSNLGSGLQIPFFHTYDDPDSDAARYERRYFVCNAATMVTDAEGKQWPAPLQCTPIFTGVVGATSAKNSGGPVGGGAILSYSFNSACVQPNAAIQYSVEVMLPWSLADIVGTSSAFLAATIEGLGTASAAKELVETELNDARVEHFLRELKPVLTPEGAATIRYDVRRIRQADKALFDGLNDWVQWLVWMGKAIFTRESSPQYSYWPPTRETKNGTVSTSMPPNPEVVQVFVDGGLLENTGIVSCLTYEDVDSIIAFVNSETKMEMYLTSEGTDGPGVFGQDGKEIPGTNIVVDSAIPPLFGFAPYSEIYGYRLKDARFATYSDRDQYMKKNQVFLSDDFVNVLQGLWNASERGKKPAIFSYKHKFLANEWFGVAPKQGREVKILWCYLNPVGEWLDGLKPDVRKIVGSIKNFPNIATHDTQLSKATVNLLEDFTSWCVAGEANKQKFVDMFK